MEVPGSSLEVPGARTDDNGRRCSFKRRCQGVPSDGARECFTRKVLRVLRSTVLPQFPLQSFQVPVWSSALEAEPVILPASFRKGSVRRCAEVFDPTSSAGAPIDRAAPVFRCSHFGLWLVQSVGSKAGVAPRIFSKVFLPTVRVSVRPEKFRWCSDRPCCPNFPLQSLWVSGWSGALEAAPDLFRTSF